MNERYALYLKTTNEPTNWDYMAFISRMKTMYAAEVPDGCLPGGIISNDNDFTKFIKAKVDCK